MGKRDKSDSSDNHTTEEEYDEYDDNPEPKPKPRPALAQTKGMSTAVKVGLGALAVFTITGIATLIWYFLIRKKSSTTDIAETASTKPTKSATASDQSSKPAVQPTTPATKPVAPVVPSATKPATSTPITNTKPVVPVVQPTTPATKPATTAEKPTVPVVQPTTSTTPAMSSNPAIPPPVATPIDYPMIYVFGAEADKPAGFDDLGEIGMIVPKADRPLLPAGWTIGGDYNGEWAWMHPHLFKGKADPKTLTDVYKFSKTASSPARKVGIISENKNVVHVFEKGGPYTSEWTWVHPYLVPASEPGGFTISDTDRGLGHAGFIRHKAAAPKMNSNLKQVGGHFGGDWTWIHPYIDMVTDVNPATAVKPPPVIPVPAPVTTDYPMIYVLGAEADKPAGFDDLGEIGVIYLQADLPRLPARWNVGGKFVDGWTWVHPRLFKGKADPKTLTNVYKFSKTAGSPARKVGILSDDKNSVHTFERGGVYTKGWTWVHPYLVPASEPGGFTISDKDRGLGHTGFIRHKAAAPRMNSNLKDVGGQYAGDWTWIHPYVDTA